MIALAVAEIGAIAQRRVALDGGPDAVVRSAALPDAKPGLNSGLMIAEVTTAA